MGVCTVLLPSCICVGDVLWGGWGVESARPREFSPLAAVSQVLAFVGVALTAFVVQKVRVFDALLYFLSVVAALGRRRLECA